MPFLSLPARHEWGEGRREGPSREVSPPPSCVHPPQWQWAPGANWLLVRHCYGGRVGKRGRKGQAPVEERGLAAAPNAVEVGCDAIFFLCTRHGAGYGVWRSV